MSIQDEVLHSLPQTLGAEQVQKLQAELLNLEQDPSNPATLDVLWQELNSLKDAARDSGLEAMARLSQQLEAVVSALQAGDVEFTLELSDGLYQGLYVIEQLIHATALEEDGVEVEPTLTRLASLLTKTHSVAPEVSLEVSLMEPASASLLQTDALYISDNELREIYRHTSEGRLQALETSLKQLTSDPTNADTLEVLRRETHSLKGDSRAVGLDPVAGLTQLVETIIKDIQAQSMPFTADVSAALDESIAAIHALVREATLGVPSDINVDQVSDRLFEAATAATLSPVDPLVSSVVEPSTARSAAESLRLNPSFIEPIQPITVVDEDAELIEIYRVTSEERLQRLETDLLYLEKHPADAATLARLMREAHSLKGDARTAGIDPVEGLAHAVEDVLTGMQRQALTLDSAVSDRLYSGLDAMGQLIRQMATGEAPNLDADQLVQELRDLVPASNEETPAAISSEVVPYPVSAGRDGVQSETVRIQTRELDALMVQADALAVARIQIAQTATQTQQLVALWEEWQANKHKPQSELSTLSHEEQLAELMLTLQSTVQSNSSKLDLVAEEIRERIRKLQLLPISSLWQPLPRVVRDLSVQQSKDVNLVLEGENTLADKRLLQGIRDSLMHLVRNAVDHGIETPEEREAAGKPLTATLRVHAYQTAVSLTIEIQDDGRGLDIEQIKRTAVKRGLYPQEVLATMPVGQVQRLILAPGFSTRRFITEISGRGVGLDVVQTQVERLKGNIQIESTPGQGTTFRLQLSTSLSTANVVLLKVKGLLFAVPIEFLQMTLLVSPGQITQVDGQSTITVDGQTVPVANLADSLELANSPSYREPEQPRQHIGDYRPCILLQVGRDRAGFFVDQLIDQLEVVSRPLHALLKRVRNVTGATVLGTGEICMILNPPDMLKSLQQQPLAAADTSAKDAARHKPVILLVEDSPPVRIQEKRLFEGAGYDVVTAKNGLEGYDILKTRVFDAVVSDVEMPYLDGFSLTSQIRQHPEYRELPIILVTTLDSDTDRQRGADAGANAHIVKGRFNQEALLETLERLI